MIALGLKLLSIVSSPFAAVWKWLLQDFRHIALVLLFCLTAIMFFRANAMEQSRDDWRAASGQWQQTAAKWQDATAAWQGAHRQLVTDVQLRTAEAEAADRARKDRIDRQQQAAIERTANDYENRIAAIRADAERLQQHTRRAAATADHQSGGAATDMPGPDQARCRAYGAADCDAFFAALPGILAEAETNTAKLTGLQSYIAELLALDWQGDNATAPMEPPR